MKLMPFVTHSGIYYDPKKVHTAIVEYETELASANRTIRIFYWLFAVIAITSAFQLVEKFLRYAGH